MGSEPKCKSASVNLVYTKITTFRDAENFFWALGSYTVAMKCYIFIGNFYPEDGGNRFLRNAHIHPNYRSSWLNRDCFWLVFRKCRVAECPDWHLSWLYSVSPRKCRNSTSN
jgi:hypothetical protein